MTEDEIRFVRKVAHHVKLGEGLLPSEVCLILILLIEAEAMRDKAQYRLEQITHSSAYNKPERDWTDPDWIKAVRERWNIE